MSDKSSNPDFKKSSELFYLKRFLKALWGEDGIYYQINEHETPDFIIKSVLGNRIGIEITKSNAAQDLYEVQSFQRSIVDTGAAYFYKEYNYGVFCSFLFRELSFPKSGIASFIQPVADLIHEKIRTKTEPYHSFSIHSQRDGLPKEIAFIKVYKPLEEVYSDWGLQLYSSLPEIVKEKIEGIIQEKEKIIQYYPEPPIEKWLLVYESQDLGSWSKEKERLSDIRIASKFDKVFYFTIENRIFDLTCNPGSQKYK